MAVVVEVLEILETIHQILYLRMEDLEVLAVVAQLTEILLVVSLDRAEQVTNQFQLHLHKETLVVPVEPDLLIHLLAAVEVLAEQGQT
jgi:hypothetical protein